MSTTGNPDLPQSNPEAMAALTRPAPATREEVIEAAVPTAKIMSGGAFKVDADVALKRFVEPYDRAFHPQGTARQMAAITAHGSRVESLKAVTAPTLVIHGTTDPLVPVEGGKDTAASVPNAELVLIEGMGHELPRGAWPQIIDPICALTERAN